MEETSLAINLAGTRCLGSREDGGMDKQERWEVCQLARNCWKKASSGRAHEGDR